MKNKIESQLVHSSWIHSTTSSHVVEEGVLTALPHICTGRFISNGTGPIDYRLGAGHESSSAASGTFCVEGGSGISSQTSAETLVEEH